MDSSNKFHSFCGGPFLEDSKNSNGTMILGFGICFQHTVLALLPCLFFWLFLPLFCFQTYRIRLKKNFKPLRRTKLFMTKLVVIKYIFVNTLIILLKNIISNDSNTVSYIYLPIQLFTLVAVYMCLLSARSTGMITSGVIHLTFVFFLICGLPELFTSIQHFGQPQVSTNLHDFDCILYLIRYPFILLIVFLLSFADKRTDGSNDKFHKAGQELKKSPELDSSFLNRITLYWFTSIPALGYRKDLEVDDLFDLNEGNTSAFLSAQWEPLWQAAIQKWKLSSNKSDAGQKIHSVKYSIDGEIIEPIFRKRNPYYLRFFGRVRSIFSKSETQRPSIVWCLFFIFKYEILSATGIKILSDVLQFAGPFLLSQLLIFVSTKDISIWNGIAIAVGMFMCSELRSLLLCYYFYLMFRVSAKIQTTLTSAVFTKSLRLANSTKKDKTVGEIINLMAIDIERFQMITPQIQQFWSCPFQITLALIYLFNVLGASAICGVVIMILFVPLNIYGSVFVKRWQVEQMKKKDERARMCSEVLNGIKVIKLYAWEPPMQATIEKIRKNELHLLRKSMLIRYFLDAFNTASPFLVAFLTFLTYTLSNPKNILTPQVAFVSLTLFNQLRSPMTMIALLIQQTVQAIVANERLKKFLIANELNPLSIERVPLGNVKSNAVEINNASFTWDLEEKVSIRDMHLNVPQGSLLAVVGKVGSGKSSLVNAILGEMEKVSGNVLIRGQIAYVPQQAWIQNLSLRDNIIFGEQFNRKFYNNIIECCALYKDIAMLTHGDMTEIGEKGINLSGGQKARVCLARAVYQNKDIYLLDDPLSAVDSHVGKHIFEKVVGPKGLLRNKTRILITHNLAFLKEVDAIIVIEDNKIVERGNLEELKAIKGKFAEFIEECTSEEENKVEDEPLDDEISEGIEDEYDESYFDEIDVFNDKNFQPDRRVSTVSNLAGNYQGSRRPSIKGSLRRRSLRRSVQYDHSKEKYVENGKKSEGLIQMEKVETGRVKFGVYLQYVKAAKYLPILLFISFFTSFSAFQLGRGIWLSKWADSNDEKSMNYGNITVSLGMRLGIYALLGCLEALSFLISLLMLMCSSINAARNLHSPLLLNILRSPMSFFDTTPTGRLLNRLGKDIDVIDQILPMNLRYFILCILNILSTMIIITFSTPIFASVIIPLLFLYYVTLRFYVPTSRQMRRLESIYRSPIYSHFGESVQGSASIRAFNLSDKFCKQSEGHVDKFIRCKYSNLVSFRWLAVRLEFVGNCVILFSALFAVLSRDWGTAITAGIAGLSVSYALNITETLNFAVRQISELETNIVAVERVKEYSETSTEAAWQKPNYKLEKGWPREGHIIFHNYSTKYRPTLDLVIKKINAEIFPAEKIGIVGRTGAGKSSLALALFRIIEPVDGQIIIDKVNISDIGLHDLRSNLTIIPQDPVLFSGSLRFNLDPFHNYDDHEIWNALSLAHLSPFVRTLPQELNHKITEGGDNISVGQRQLVCLTRALLRRSKVLMLDEATAAVDLVTDALIQETIRKEFKSSTVLTIAHRLNTILDYDRVLVLDGGFIKEFDSPRNLLANRYSLFHAMAIDAKIILPNEI